MPILKEIDYLKFKTESLKDNEGVFVLDPLLPGYGVTLGNAIRRVALSSIEGNAITSIKGAGNSNSILHYTALDAFPLKGINYYRLKQTDYNSKYAFSKIISVNTIDNNCELEISQLYMQSNTLNLTLNCIDSKICIDIIDITGRVVFSQNFNSLEKSQNILLTLPALIKGVYFAKVTSDKTVVVKKFSL